MNHLLVHINQDIKQEIKQTSLFPVNNMGAHVLLNLLRDLRKSDGRHHVKLLHGVI